MENNLKPCPFCGCNAVIHTKRDVCVGHGVYVDKYYAECLECGAESKESDTYSTSVSGCIEQVVARWNRRV